MLPKDEGNPPAVSNPLGSGDARKQLPKEFADSADKFFGFLAVVFGGIGGILYKAGPTMPAMIFAVTAILFSLLAAYFKISSNLFGRLYFGKHPVTAICTVCVCLCIWAGWVWVEPQIWPSRPPPPPKQFNITPSIGIVAPRPSANLNVESLGRLALGNRIFGKVVLKPIDWMIYVTLANNQDIPTRIEAYLGYAGERGRQDRPWTPLCRVALGEGSIFLLDDNLRDVAEQGTSKAIDRRLMEQTIGPHDSVSGWLAWECPNASCGTWVKLVIREANGRISETDGFEPSGLDAPLHDTWPEVLAVHENLADTPVEVRSSCGSSGTGGLMALFPKQRNSNPAKGAK